LGDEERALEQLQGVAEGDSWRVERRLCRFDGSEFDQEFRTAEVIVCAPRGERFGAALAMVQHLRRSGVSAPVLMIGTPGQRHLASHALYAGADDYQCAPFARSELLARIRALRRRKNRAFTMEHSHGDFVLDRTTRELLFKGKEIELTSTQFRVLERLFLQKGAAVPAHELFDVAFGYDVEITEGAVRVLISRIRRRLRQAGAPDIVRAKWGLGYHLW
jgi:DNA-binding response OmpR family regulator